MCVCGKWPSGDGGRIGARIELQKYEIALQAGLSYFTGKSSYRYSTGAFPHALPPERGGRGSREAGRFPPAKRSKCETTHRMKYTLGSLYTSLNHLNHLDKVFKSIFVARWNVQREATRRPTYTIHSTHRRSSVRESCVVRVIRVGDFSFTGPLAYRRAAQGRS